MLYEYSDEYGLHIKARKEYLARKSCQRMLEIARDDSEMGLMMLNIQGKSGREVVALNDMSPAMCPPLDSEKNSAMLEDVMNRGHTERVPLRYCEEFY